MSLRNLCTGSEVLDHWTTSGALYFKIGAGLSSTLGKTTSEARNLINSAPKTAAMTFAFAFVFILQLQQQQLQQLGSSVAGADPFFVIGTQRFIEIPVLTPAAKYKI